MQPIASNGLLNPWQPGIFSLSIYTLLVAVLIILLLCCFRVCFFVSSYSPIISQRPCLHKQPSTTECSLGSIPG